jgi:polysaccharide pyruvyl transferase WcaK-like protein
MAARPYRVVLHGAYHTDNYGDMLLMLLYRRWIEEAGEGVEVRMPFLPPATAHQLDAPPGRGAIELRGVDTFVYGGGGYFGEPPTGVARWGLRLTVRHLLPGLAVALGGGDLVLSGVGAGPVTFGPARGALAHILSRARLVSVRDEASRAFLVGLGARAGDVHVTADAALVLRPASLPAAAVRFAAGWLATVPPAPRLGVHVGGASAAGPGYRALLDDVLAFARERPDLRLVPLSDQTGARGQVEAIEELAGRLPGRCDPYRYDEPWRLTALLGRLDMVVTTKLHVGIVAAALGTPVLSYPRHPKVGRFYEQVGAPEASTPLAGLRPGRALDDLRARFGRPEAAVSIPDDVRDAADANRRLLQRHLRARLAGGR